MLSYSGFGEAHPTGQVGYRVLLFIGFLLNHTGDGCPPSIRITGGLPALLTIPLVYYIYYGLGIAFG